MAVAPQVVRLAGHLTARQAAERMGCTVPYIYQLVRDGRLTNPLRIECGPIIFKEADIDRYIAEHPSVGRIRHGLPPRDPSDGTHDTATASTSAAPPATAAASAPATSTIPLVEVE